jgi:hypothetical protein
VEGTTAGQNVGEIDPTRGLSAFQPALLKQGKFGKYDTKRGMNAFETFN